MGGGIILNTKVIAGFVKVNYGRGSNAYPDSEHLNLEPIRIPNILKYSI